MRLDSEKLKKLIENEAKDMRFFDSSSFFIGEINNNPVMITVMTLKEAVNTHDYNGLKSINKTLICIKD